MPRSTFCKGLVMNVVSKNELTECIPLTPALKSKYSDGCHIYLDPEKAIEMQRDEQVKIVYNDPVKEKKFIKTITEPHKYYDKNAFTGGKIKVAWIQDYEMVGGAELSNLQVLKVGVNCGFDIVCVTPQNNNLDILKESDVIIINNFYHFSMDQERYILDYIGGTKIPYIIYSHDMRDLKRMDEWQCMYENSAYNVFISPRHKGIYNVDNDSVTLPLAIDLDNFFAFENVKREEGSVFIPTMAKQGKEIWDFLQKNPHYKYYAINTTHPQITNVKGVKNELMHKIYSKFETVYHCPEKFWAGDRVLFEAQLCGCKVIANDNVGHKSWGFGDDIDKIKEELRKAPFTFWKEVEKYVKSNCIS